MIRILFYLLFVTACTPSENAKSTEPWNSEECRDFQKLRGTVRKDCKVDTDCFRLTDVNCDDFTGNVAEKDKLEAARDKCKKVWEKSALRVMCDPQRPHEYKCKNQICEWTPL